LHDATRSTRRIIRLEASDAGRSVRARSFRHADHRSSLCEACACGQEATVAFLVDLDETDLDALGPDGVSPLCAATIWGYNGIVRLLVEATCNPNVRNRDATRSTALHAAAAQEHGKIVHLLLQAGADATLEDGESRMPSDFASVSDAVWPLFAVRGRFHACSSAPTCRGGTSPSCAPCRRRGRASASARRRSPTAAAGCSRSRATRRAARRSRASSVTP
jgi:hypothetical protein